MNEYLEKNAVLDCFHDWIDKNGEVHTADEMPEYRAIEALPATITVTDSCDSISRQAAIKAIRKLPNAGIHWFVSAEAVFDALLKLPPVQPEIIRCKDCKYYKTMFCAMDTWTAEITIYKAQPDDFCSRAER